MPPKKLTDIAIRNLKPGPARREIPDPGARGLYVIVQPSGVKSFAVRYRYAGKPRKLTLTAGITARGRAQGRSRRALSARARSRPERDQAPGPAGAAARGGRTRSRPSPRSTRNGKAAGCAAPTGAAACSSAWCIPTLGDRPIAEIKRSEIIRLLDKIEDGELQDGTPLKGGPVMADRTLAIIRRIMNWHATRCDAFRSPIVRGMARADEGARTRILTDDELRRVWQAAEAGEGPFDRLVQFLLLTAARRSEAAAMTWQEIDGTDWTLPASRNKTKVDLVRPLSAAAQDVLARVPRLVGCPFVFSTDGTSADRRLHALQEAVRRAVRRDRLAAARSAAHGAQPHEPRRCQFRSCRALPRPRHRRRSRRLRPPRISRREAARLRGAGGADRAHRGSVPERRGDAPMTGRKPRWEAKIRPEYEDHEQALRVVRGELGAFADQLPAEQQAIYLATLLEYEDLMARAYADSYRERTFAKSSVQTAAATTKKKAKGQLTYTTIALLAAPILQKHPSWNSWRIAGEIEGRVNAGRERPLSRHRIREYVSEYRSRLQVT